VNHSLYWLATMGVALSLVSIAHAGRVRDLYSNDKIMQPVHLTMGRSTVLRFDEKPTTSVLGNQNYFNLEYIGNDITVQPQGVVTTNLFVYTESQTYGIILKVGPESLYDDLVYVKWRPQYVNVTDQRQKKIEILQERPLNTKLEFKGVVRVNLKKLTRSIAQGVLIIDMEIQNLAKMPLKSGDLRFVVSDGKVNAQVVTTAKQDQIPPAGQTELRLVTRLPGGNGLQLTVKHGDKAIKASLAQKGRS
jgi:hypothetical protein